MSELINRQDAIDAIQKRADEVDSVYSAFWEGLKIAQDIVEKVPSVEPKERTVKVIEHDASIMDNRGYKYLRSEYLCENCKKKVIGGEDYCSHCGAKLDWGENE